MEFHEVLANTPGHSRPGNQVDVESFVTARNQEMQALLKEIRKLKDYLKIKMIDGLKIPCISSKLLL